MTTGNAKMLCQNCGATYTPDNEFCGNCGKRLTAVGRTLIPTQGSTPIPPPAPTPKYPGPLTPTQPAAPSRQFWTRGKTIVLFILLFIIIESCVYSFAYQNGRNSTQTQPTATTASRTTPTTASRTTPTTASRTTPTTASRTITKNLDIPCVIGCYSNLDLKLTTIVIDTTHQQSTWNFTLSNHGDPGSFSFDSLVLEDGTGQKHQAGGLASTDTWYMNSGQSIQTYATFDVVHGTNYLLNMQLNGSTYQTETISF